MAQDISQPELNGQKLWWVEDQSETVIARTEQEAREFYGAEPEHKSGPVTWDDHIKDEDDGTVTALSELFLAVVRCEDNVFPAQLSTSA